MFEDRPVTAALVHTAPGQRPRTVTWLMDPGIEIPAEAAAVHGWTTERLLARVGGPGRAVKITTAPDGPRVAGMTATAALAEIADQVAALMHIGTPIVVANAAYDMSLLETNLDRAGLPTLSSRDGGVRGVVDPMCIDRQWDPYRKSCYKAPGCKPDEQHHECGGCRGGKHKCGGCGVTNKRLESLAAHYGVVLAGAHEATADALAAVRVAKRLGDLWADTGRLTLPTLFKRQVEWRAAQQRDFASYAARFPGRYDGEFDTGWPLHTRLVERQAVAS